MVPMIPVGARLSPTHQGVKEWFSAYKSITYKEAQAQKTRVPSIFGRRIWPFGIDSVAATVPSRVLLVPLRRCQEQLRAFLEFHVPLGKHNDTCRFSFRIFSNL